MIHLQGPVSHFDDNEVRLVRSSTLYGLLNEGLSW